MVVYISLVLSWFNIFNHIRNLDAVFLRDSIDHFPKHLNGFPTIDGISSPWICIFTSLLTRPILNTRHLDLFGLNLHLCQENAIFRRCYCDAIDEASNWCDECLSLSLALLSLLLQFWSTSPTISNRIREIVHPVTIPFLLSVWIWCGHQQGTGSVFLQGSSWQSLEPSLVYGTAPSPTQSACGCQIHRHWLCLTTLLQSSSFFSWPL